MCYFIRKTIKYVKGNGKNDRKLSLIVNGERIKITKHVTNICYWWIIEEKINIKTSM